jgi:hypothetical protein
VSLNPFKSLDKYFLACKILTLIFCLPWPLTLIASVMSLAGEFSPNTSLVMRGLVRFGWLLVLVYPAIFFAIVLFAEKILARKSYVAGAVLAGLPTAFSLVVLYSIFIK